MKATTPSDTPRPQEVPGEDPVTKLARRAESRAADLSAELRDCNLPRALRARGRAALVKAFRVLSEPPGAALNERREWVRRIRPLLATMDAIDSDIRAFRKPPPPFYARGRLGVIRMVEPVRIRFVIGRLNADALFERTTLLAGLERRVDWLWDRLRRSHPDLFADKNKEPTKTMRDEHELIWGRVRR